MRGVPYHAVSLEAVPLVNSPLHCLLVVRVVVVERDVSSHVPKESLVVFHGA